MSMPAKPDEAPPQSYTEEGSILDIVDELRTVSVSKYVHLPQMIICGSKSNAKRSVIESISGVSFPSRNDFYTGFVTEIILRYDLTPRFKVSIRPGPTRISEGDLWHLESFDPPVHDNTEQSVALIEQATQLVKFSLEDGFSDDVMRVEVSGPDKPDPTLIDMPRFFFADGIDNGGREKTPSRRTIENYVLNQRCIILPVVSAKIDICPQKLIDFADKSASEVPLGLHLVCTKSSETRHLLDEEREEKEKEFFDRGDWKTLTRQFVGAGNLRRRLSSLLVDHVRSSLPDLVQGFQTEFLNQQ
ncbi:hypothetical protein CBS147372_9563 [Penicillium roqueforti]|nr:hypothetical protein CBS147372_9563 [Penicillium roqueforti]